MISESDNEDSLPIIPSALWELVASETLLLAQAEIEKTEIAETATILKTFLLAKFIMIST